jgi:hypothetical protein
VTRSVAAAWSAAAVLTLGACGTTYIDTGVTVPDTSPTATTTTLAPVDPDAPLDELLGEIQTLMVDLDERIIDRRDPAGTLTRLLQLWRAAESQIRRNDPDDVYNFQQAIDLARSGVERQRPADASKGYKIFADVAEAYLAGA